MKTAIFACICIISLLTSAPVFSGDAGQGKPQEFCPVMGGRIDKKLFSDSHGQRVYFCCAYCPGEFAKNPEKYIEKMKQEGVATEKAPLQDKKK